MEGMGDMNQQCTGNDTTKEVRLGACVPNGRKWIARNYVDVGKHIPPWKRLCGVPDVTGIEDEVDTITTLPPTPTGNGQGQTQHNRHIDKILVKQKI